MPTVRFTCTAKGIQETYKFLQLIRPKFDNTFFINGFACLKQIADHQVKKSDLTFSSCTKHVNE